LQVRRLPVRCLSINGSASSGVELFMLEVCVKVLNVVGVVIFCFVMNLYAFESGEEHIIVIIKIVVLDISLEALARLVALLV
jgi:hypothetical protein